MKTLKSAILVVLIIVLASSGAWSQVSVSRSGIPPGTTRSDGSAHQNNDTLLWSSALNRWIAAAGGTWSSLTGDPIISMSPYSTLADHGYIGFTIPGVAGEALAIGDVVYLKAADSRWWKARANASTTMSADPKIAVSVAAGAGSAVTLLEWGYIRHDAWGLTTNGASVYVDRTTPGLVTQTAPSTVGDQVQILGQVTDAVADNIIAFHPSQLLLEVGSGLTLPLSGTIATSATPYPSSDGTATGTQVEFFAITALGSAAELKAPVGTPNNGQRLMIRITDVGGPWALTYVANTYRESTDLPKPTTTTANKTIYMNFIYNSTVSRWDYIGQLDNF